MKRLRLFLLFAATTAFAAPDALVDTAALWSDPRIEVCFGTSATRINPKADMAGDVRRARVIRGNSPYEERIRKLLTEQFTAERTGTSFVGFGNCDRVPDDEPNAPAFIMADTDLPDFGITSIGDESLFLPAPERRGLISGSVMNLRKIKANKDYSVARAAKALIRVAGSETTANQILNLTADLDDEIVGQLRDITVLHEMGHLAGLLHEERRKDSRAGQPEWCRSAGDEREQEKETEKTYGTEFDPFSIMNYCADDIVKGFGFYHLFCQFPRVAAALSEKNPKFDWRQVAPYCDYMMARSYAARLSARDRGALRRAYLGITIPPGQRTYRTNPEEVRVIEALGALYDALPESMDVGTLPAAPRPSR